MQSNLNTRLTTNYNTMFKWCSQIFLILLLCICSPLTTSAASEDTEDTEEISYGDADFLLLHGDGLSDEELTNLRLLADTATALGKSMDIAAPEQVEGLYDQYDLILRYDLPSDSVLADRLIRSGTKILILGGDLLPDCLLDTDASLPVVMADQEGSGVFQYDFAEQSEYETILSLPEHVYYLRSDPDYENGTIETDARDYPFCFQIGNVRYIPLIDFQENLSRAALMWELSTWLWDYDGLPPQKGQYIVLDEIYAYMPAQDLLDRVQLLIDAHLPFVLSVMPVYQNGDYPAMQQFCEVLRYAQANGGAVILHAPIVRGDVEDWDEYNASISEAVLNLTSQNVYPLGFDVPYSYTWNEQALEWMKRTRTAFIYEDEKTPDFDEKTSRNLLYYNYHALILPSLSLDDGGENQILQFSSSQRIPVSISLEDLRTTLATLQENRSAYYSLWDNNQSVWIDGYHLSWQNGAMTMNDVLCSLAYTPQSPIEDYDYQRNILTRFTVNIQNESQGLIFLVSGITILFLLMILYARRRQQKNFLEKRRDDECP